MKLSFKRLLAPILTLALVMPLAVFHASAADSLSFDCFLIIRESASISATTFEYTIAAGEAVPAVAGTETTPATPAVLPGIVENGKPSIGTAVFADNEEAATTVAQGDGITLEEGRKYAKKTVPVDFDDITFTEPGIYRYVITQTVNSEYGDTVGYDTQIGDEGTPGTRYLDVYVVNGDSGLVVSYLLHETADVASANPVGDKATGFVNAIADTFSLSFGKEVTGNQGSKNKYFKFTLALGGLKADAEYTVDLTTGGAESAPATNFSTTYSTMSNPATVTADADGTATVEFYLKDGQYVSIAALPAKYTYTLSEDAEDYVSKKGIASADNAGNVAYQDDIANSDGTSIVNTDGGVSADLKTGFTNEREGIIPTGILLTITPFAVGLFLFGAVFFYMMARRRRKS